MTATIEWSHNDSGADAFIAGDMVGTVKLIRDGPKLGVWNGERGRMLWYVIDRDDSAHDILTRMHERGELEVIPEHADMRPQAHHRAILRAMRKRQAVARREARP